MGVVCGPIAPHTRGSHITNVIKQFFKVGLAAVKYNASLKNLYCCKNDKYVGYVREVRVREIDEEFRCKTL